MSPPLYSRKTATVHIRKQGTSTSKRSLGTMEEIVSRSVVEASQFALHYRISQFPSRSDRIATNRRRSQTSLCPGAPLPLDRYLPFGRMHPQGHECSLSTN